jgi:hypothetical protein
MLADSIHEGRRPTRIDNPPSKGEIKKLRERLSTFGRKEGRALTEEMCVFLSEHVIAPASVRAQLQRPSVRPSPSGNLEIIYATVLVDALIPDPGNGRVVGATAWPAADKSPDQTLKLWAPSDVHVHPESSCEVLVQADNVTEFKRVMEDVATKTKQLNPNMRIKIERDGILDPLLCQLVHVQTADGFSGAALVTRDGSTRASFAKEIHAAMPYDALFGDVRDLEARRQRWLEMKHRYESPASELTPSEMHQLRTFLVDVMIVIGFTPHTEGATVLDAVEDIVRRTHVETSYPWTQVAQDNNQADQVLGSLRNAGVIDGDQFLLYGGKLSRDDRIAKGLPGEPDVLLADLLRTFGATGTARETQKLHDVIRTVTYGGQVRTAQKATWSGSLALRQFYVEGRSLQSANTTLAESLRVEAIWDEQWENTTRSPAELRAAALAELERNSEPGPSARELLVKASGHLAAQGWMRAQISGGRNLERDQRQPNVVLDAMHRTPQGIYVLAEALAAGRRGAEARALDQAGEIVERAGGDATPLSNEWIRRTFKETGSADDGEIDDRFVNAQTPRERIIALLRKAEGQTAGLKQTMRTVAEVKDSDGQSYLDRYGLSRGETDRLVEDLQQLSEQLRTYALTAKAVQNLPPLEAAGTQLPLEAMLGDSTELVDQVA